MLGEELEGIVGIFGPNKIGKSSIIAALMYALFNTTDRGPLKGAHIINKNKSIISLSKVKDNHIHKVTITIFKSTNKADALK